MRQGRPVSVFKADCWGYTIPSEVKEQLAKRGLQHCVNEDSGPNTASRFPVSTSFTTKEECALECDFWKLVLLKKFFLSIPFSHGSVEEYLSAAEMAQQTPLERLENDDAWGAELHDFIEQHRAQLWQHRDLNKPELDLDAFEKHAREKDDWRLRSWVEGVREAQKDLEQFNRSTPGSLVERIETTHKYFCSAASARVPQCRSGSPFAARLNEYNNAVAVAVVSVRDKGEKLIQEIEKERARLTAALEKLTNERPPSL